MAVTSYQDIEVWFSVIIFSKKDRKLVTNQYLILQMAFTLKRLYKVNHMYYSPSN